MVVKRTLSAARQTAAKTVETAKRAVGRSTRSAAGPADGQASAVPTSSTTGAEATKTTAANQTVAKKTATKKTATKKAATKKAATKKAATKKAATKKASATGSAAAKAPAKKAPAKKAPAKKAPAKKAPAKNASAKKAPAKNASATKTPAKKTAAKKTPATSATTAVPRSTEKTTDTTGPSKSAAAKKAPATKTPAKKASARKSTGKKATTTRASAAAASLPVRPDESPWTEAELREVRAEIENDIAGLRAELEHARIDLVDLMRDSGDGAGDDQADAGAKTYEREQEISLANNARDMLEQNEHALARLENGTYGICESCGNPIGKLRLQAAPRATLCMPCKTQQERR